MHPNDQLRMEGPFGSLYLRDNDRPIIFVVSGAGYAPIHALLEKLKTEGRDTRSVYLYWGERRRVDLYNHKILLDMEKTTPWFHYIPVLSEASSKCGWRGKRGFAHFQVVKDFVSLDGYEVYACGSPIAVESASKYFIKGKGLPEKSFFVTCYL